MSIAILDLAIQVPTDLDLGQPHTDSLELASQVSPAVSGLWVRIEGADPILAKQGRAIAHDIAVTLRFADRRRGGKRVDVLSDAVEHCHQLMLFLRRPLSCGYLDFVDLYDVLSLVHRVVAFVEDQGAEYQARLNQRALLRAVARQAKHQVAAPCPF